MSQPCILALDQGTTSSRAIVFDARGHILHVAQREFPQIYPASGWVEHDPEIIWVSTLEVARNALAVVEGQGHQVAAIGLTNQRETTLLWDRESGRPVHNAIVWQDRRTRDTCERMRRDGLEDEVQRRSGLLLDPYFSASKLAWMLGHVDRARSHAQAGELAFGTVDAFLISRLTDGAVHATDHTNACRTGLYNLTANDWDDELLSMWDIPPRLLPEILGCSASYGETHPALFGRPIPILGVAGDQQAAALGQCCFQAGDIKSTYGTGCFVLVHTGRLPLRSSHRLLSTVAVHLDGKAEYALEGSIFVAGAAVQWLRDGLGVIGHAADSEGLANGLADNGGVYLVPAFTGLGAPHWKPDARGALFGITRATGPAELARAALESVCYQTQDLLQAMSQDGVSPKAIRVDGGMVANDWMTQFLADVLDMPVDRPRVMETTALGAAYLAGRRAGVYGNREEFSQLWRLDTRFEPGLDGTTRQRLLDGWHDAVSRVVG
ncbi:MAG: glycerol kinase GlpK [Xanthomonadales bacterium]|nr:glycerol kinase GlpK [Xanthomonadales bacterium]